MSKATKLEEVGFRFSKYSHVLQIVETLNTITSEHEALKQVSIHLFSTSLGSGPARLQMAVHWADLDQTLVQLWELRRIPVKILWYHIECEAQEPATREHIEWLLPKMTAQGGIEFGFGGYERRPTGNYHHCPRCSRRIGLGP